MQYKTKVKVECEGEEVTWPVTIHYSVRISGGSPIVDVEKTLLTPSSWVLENVSPLDIPFPLWEITAGFMDSALDRAMIRQWKREQDDALRRLGEQGDGTFRVTRETA